MFLKECCIFLQIPSSAVEMPGDLKSIGLLDVQFGAMDLISDNMSFDSVADTKFNSTNSAKLDNANTTPSANLDLSNPNQNSTIDAYSSQQKTNTSSISPALSQSVSYLNCFFTQYKKTSNKNILFDPKLR